MNKFYHPFVEQVLVETRGHDVKRIERLGQLEALAASQAIDAYRRQYNGWEQAFTYYAEEAEYCRNLIG